MNKSYKPVDLSIFKEGLLILETKKDSKGNSYNSFGTLNQAAFMGERVGCLIEEIEYLRERLSAVVGYFGKDDFWKHMI